MALVGAAEILLAADGHAQRFSPLFHYWFARRGGPFDLLDVQTGMDALVDHGLCPQHLHPPNGGARPHLARTVAMGEAEPDAKAVEAASRYRGHIAWRLARVFEPEHRVRRWKAALGASRVVLLALDLPDSYHELADREDAELQPGTPSGEGHLVLITGYGEGLFRVRDSRGAAFGRQGDWFLSDALARSSAVTNSWIMG